MSGNIFECLKRYANSLTDGQINEIISGMEQGLADKQIKSYFNLPEEKMRQYRRAFVFKNRAAQTGS